MVVGVVLCGGQSRRMGVPKAELRWPMADSTQTWLAHAQCRLAAVCEQVVVSGSSELPDTVPGQVGPLAGVVAALRRYPQCVFLPVDMPLVQVDDLLPLVQVAPAAYRGSVFPLSLTASALTLAEARLGQADPRARSVQGLLADLGAAVRWLNGPPERLQNVNTPEQLRALNEVNRSMSAMQEFEPLMVAVLTVSDTRSMETDTSGAYLVEQLQAAGHRIAARALVRDDVYQMRSEVSAWIAEPSIQVVLVTGGTGLTGRDSTPEALSVLFDKTVDGFGELFRHLSLADIGTATVQSRALAGLANGTLIFCLPGSTGACRLAWEGILAEQLDSRTKPCNFVPHVRRS